jgi:hypothetical protein
MLGESPHIITRNHIQGEEACVMGCDIVPLAGLLGPLFTHRP